MSNISDFLHTLKCSIEASEKLDDSQLYMSSDLIVDDRPHSDYLNAHCQVRPGHEPAPTLYLGIAFA